MSVGIGSEISNPDYKTPASVAAPRARLGQRLLGQLWLVMGDKNYDRNYNKSGDDKLDPCWAIPSPH